MSESRLRIALEDILSRYVEQAEPESDYSSAYAVMNAYNALGEGPEAQKWMEIGDSFPYDGEEDQ